VCYVFILLVSHWLPELSPSPTFLTHLMDGIFDAWDYFLLSCQLGGKIVTVEVEVVDAHSTTTSC
jgi:hypothetical protein